MIEKCDAEIASWSESGDNFVVKNVEKFATVSFSSLSMALRPRQNPFVPSQHRENLDRLSVDLGSNERRLI